ncbi:MAG: MmcQ/YjbR family DNA-binding protein [Clostridia bacterium]
MTQQQIYDFCLTLEDSKVDFPFDFETMVFRHKSNNRIFLFFMRHFSDNDITLKGSPVQNEFLRQNFDYVKEGYHLNTIHWITILATNCDNDKLLQQLIVDSYNLTLKKQNKKN